ncbi:hypothetical protein OG21DRAFT_1482708 [Imleria badia]|nr:hypothetical protein OG21DRAFT_1482708 [Imleria badia]
MAGQHGYQTKHIRLVAFLVLVCLAAGLVRRVMSSPRSSISTSSRSNWSTHRDTELVQPNLNPDTDPQTLRPDRIHGRWEAVRASLGLPPLPHEDGFAPGPDLRPAGRPDKRASRFDLGRKRRADEAARQLPLLHFAPDT